MTMWAGSVSLSSSDAKLLRKLLHHGTRLLSVIAVLASGSALAQQATSGPPPWSALPRMQLERQFAGPLQDTVIQRWRDPVDGTVCYLYIPITASHSGPTPSGYVQYGPNTIGSLSCVASPPAAPPKPATKPAPKSETAPR